MSIRSLLPAVLLSTLAACLQGQDLGDTERLGSGPDDRPADSLVDGAVIDGTEDSSTSLDTRPGAAADVALAETFLDVATEASVDGAEEAPAEAGNRILGLAFAPKELVLDEGSETKPSVLATTAGGEIVDVTARASLSTVDATVATIREGVVQAQAPGETRLDATVDGLRATATIRVRSATLVGLTIYPQPTGAEPAVVVPFTGGLAFRAMGTYAHGGIRDLSNEVAWTVGDARIGSIVTTAGVVKLVPKRLEHTATPGSGRLSASFRGVAADVSFRVQPAATSIAFQNNNHDFRAPIGARGFIVGATATCDDGWERSDFDFSYRSSAPAIVSLTEVRGVLKDVTFARIEPRAAGTADITVTYGGLSATRPFVVTSARLSRLEIASTRGVPLPLVLPRGAPVPFTISGVWTDGHRENVSEVATLATEGSGAADLEPFLSPLIKGRTNGSVTLRATHLGVTASHAFRVVDRVWASTKATPSVVDCAVGESVPIAIEATLASGDSLRFEALQDADGSSSSSAPAVAEIVKKPYAVLECRAAGKARIEVQPRLSPDSIPAAVVQVTVR
jgi:hypothetical protein